MLELTESLALADIESAMPENEVAEGNGGRFLDGRFRHRLIRRLHPTRLPLDELKIDKLFVARPAGQSERRGDRSDGDFHGAESQSVGDSRGRGTAAQRDALHAIGRHAYQGYLIARPPPIDQFVVFFYSRRKVEPLPMIGKSASSSHDDLGVPEGSLKWKKSVILAKPAWQRKSEQAICAFGEDCVDSQLKGNLRVRRGGAALR